MMATATYNEGRKSGDKMNQLIQLCKLPMNQTAVVVQIIGNGRRMKRIVSMGITEGAEITPVFRSPFGEPVAYEVKHTLIALRQRDSRQIWVRRNDDI